MLLKKVNINHLFLLKLEKTRHLIKQIANKGITKKYSSWWFSISKALTFQPGKCGTYKLMWHL
jgi:hypothetical protein